MRAFIWMISLLLCCCLFSYAQSDTRQAVRDSLLRAATQLSTEGRFEDVINVLRPLADSASGPELFALGSAYAAVNDVVPALSCLEKATAKSPAYSPYRLKYAQALVQSGRTEAGETQYRTVLASDSLNPTALIQLGTLLQNRNANEEAATVLTKASVVQPRNYLVFYYLGSLLTRLAHQDSARAMLSTSLSLNSSYLPTLSLLGSLYFQKSDFEGALRMFERAVETHPLNADMYYKAGVCLEHLGKPKDAKSYLQQAIALDSLNESCFAHLGQIYFQLEQFDSSVIAYGQAFRINDGNPLYPVNMALGWQRLDSVAQAAACLRLAIHVNRPESIGQIYERLGHLYYAKKRYQEARDAYTKGLQFDPDNFEAQFFLAVSYDHLKQSRQAVAWYKRFLTTGTSRKAPEGQLETARDRIRTIAVREHASARQ